MKIEKDGMISVKVNSILKNESEILLDKLGLDIDSYINMSLSQLVHEQGMPFQPSINGQAEKIRIRERNEQLIATMTPPFFSLDPGEALPLSEDDKRILFN